MSHARLPYVLVWIGNSELNSALIVLVNAAKFKPSCVTSAMTLE